MTKVAPGGRAHRSEKVKQQNRESTEKEKITLLFYSPEGLVLFWLRPVPECRPEP